MPSQFKGLVDLYDSACIGLSESPFFSWFDSAQLNSGQICTAPAWYEKNNRYYLDSAENNPFDESQSKWFVRKYPTEGKVELQQENYVQKYFNIEFGEHIIATHCKRRPVILVKKTESQWFSKVYPKSGWLCLPIFSYRPRHTQEDVLRDQALEVPLRFFLPKRHDNNPGMDMESAVHIDFMQTIEDKYIEPMRIFNATKNMETCFGVSYFSLKLIIIHLYNYIGIVDLFIHRESEEDVTYYDLFVEEVQKIVDKKRIEIKKHNTH